MSFKRKKKMSAYEAFGRLNIKYWSFHELALGEELEEKHLAVSDRNLYMEWVDNTTAGVTSSQETKSRLIWKRQEKPFHCRSKHCVDPIQCLVCSFQQNKLKEVYSSCLNGKSVLIQRIFRNLGSLRWSEEFSLLLLPLEFAVQTCNTSNRR